MFSRFLGVFSGRGSRRVPKTGFTALTSKIGPKNFYKGKGVPSVGHHTRKGECSLEHCFGGLPATGSV